MKILIVRLSSIGDIVMASPLVRAFRRTWPEAQISWLVEEASKPALEANPELDEIIVWKRRNWRRLFKERRFITFVKEVFSFTKSLRRENFDLAVDAQGLLKSGIWTFLSGATERVGIGSREGSRFLMTRVIDRTGASDRISSQYYLLAKALNLDTGDFKMDMALSPEAVSYAERFAESLVVPYIVFTPFTTRPQKHWFEDRWTELATRFLERKNFAIVILGGPDDYEDSKTIFPIETDRKKNLTGQTTIQQAGGLIKRASLVIGVDTGLTHMGIALETPTIALFGATRPYLDTSGTSGTVLYHARECSPCRRSPTCDGDYTCMKVISIEEVFSAATTVLEGK